MMKALSYSSRLASSAMMSRVFRFNRCATRALSTADASPIPSTKPAQTVIGEANDHGLDLSTAWTGQRLDIPYEITVGSTWRDLWQSNFYMHDRIFTSKSFAKSLGFKDVLMPPGLLTFMTGSMSHVDPTKEVMDLGYQNAVYERAAYAGDTLSKTFYIKALRGTSTGSGTVVTIDCEIINKDTNERVFRVDKLMLFPDVKTNPSQQTRDIDQAFHRFETPAQVNDNGEIYNSIVSNQSLLPTATSLESVRPHQLLLHSHSRPIGQSNSINLATLFRQTHPLLHNLQRYKPDEIVVAGGLVLAAAHACSAKSLYEVLFEKVIDCSFQNRVSTRDSIGAISYILDVQSIGSNLEEVTVRTIGVKDVDVIRDLKDVSLPEELFLSDGLRPKEYEAICEQYCPQLKGKIVVQSKRKLLRQAPMQRQEPVFLL